MTILQQPDALSFSMNLKPFKISTSEEVEFSLMQGGETLFSEMLSPDADGQIELSLRDIIHDRLSCQVPPTADPYVQSSVVADFTAVIGSTSVTFRVIRGGVDRLSGTVNDFLRANFLTWQPNVKPVTYSSPEFLSYYAVDSGCKLKVKAYFTDSAGNVTPGAVKTICSLAQGVVTTVSVQYAVIAGLYSDSLPAYYDVWVASGSTALTYTQRYYASTMRSEEEQWMFFENSLGGIDTFRTFGAVTLDAEHTHHIAEIDDVSYEYRVDTERKWTVNTGHLDISERRWLLDFFPSAGKYVYAGSAVRRIVLTDDSVSYRFRELPSSYSFTFRFAETLPLLNLPRHELPVEMLDITVPDIGSFTLPPRLLEFSRLPLSEGVLFPVQSPYAEEWQVVTMGGITQYLRSVLDIPSPGLGRTDIIRLLSAQLTPLDPLHPEESRIDPSWLPEGYGIIDIEHVTGLREELDSKLDTRFFSNVFTVYDGSGNAIVPNTYEQVADNLKIMVGAWTDQYLSALGLNSQGGGGETGGVSGIRVSSSSVLTPDDEGVVNMAGYVIQPAEKTRWDAAAAMRHAHSNKSILDSITSQQISSWNALTAVRILPGDGLAGGGDLSADVTLSVKLASNSGLSVSSGGLKLDAVNALNSTLTYKALSAAQGKALNDRLAILEAMFTREGSGTSADPYVIRANYGLYTDSFLSALGLNSQGGGGGGVDLAAMWDSLTNAVSDSYSSTLIASAHIPGLSASKITSGTFAAARIPDMASTYGYLKTHQTLYTLSIYGGTTKVLDFKPDVNASIYIKAGGDISLANDTTNRYITLSYSHPTGGANTTISAANGRVLSAITVNSLGHVTSVSSKTLAAADIPSLAWDKITSGKPTTLGGYGITDAKIASGVITLGGNTITPVTSVSMTVPTGFSVSGSPISKTGTLALSYTSGYEGFTTDLKNKINLLYSLFTREGSGTSADPYVIRANYGLYTDSFLSSLGQNSQGGGGSTFDEDQMWAALRSNTGTYANEKINANHIPDIASKYGYATQTWVTNNFNKYTLPLAASGTRGGVQIGYTTSGKNYAVQLSGEKMYVNVPWENTTYSAGAGISISSGTIINNGVRSITKHSTTAYDILLINTGGTIDYLDLSHQHSYWEILDKPTDLEGFGLTSELNASYAKVSGSNATGTWGISVSGNAATATKFATAQTIWGQSFDGSGNVSGALSGVSGISFTNRDSVEVDNCGNIKLNSGENKWWHVDTNAGILVFAVNSSGNVGIGLSSPTYKLQVNGTFRASGNSSIGGTLGVTGATTLTDLLTANGNIVTGTSNGAYIQIGAIKLVYDSTNNALKVIKSDNTAANLYATGAVSALGANSSGGGGGDFSEAQMWAALQSNTGTYANEKIDTNHIPDMAGIYGYLKQSALNNYVTSVKVGSTAYNPSSGVVSLPAYPTKLSQLTNDSGYVTSSGVTSVTLKAGTGISLDVDNTAITSTGTRTITNSGVRAATINGNYLRVNTNGTNADLTIPYATSAGSVAWGNVSGKPTTVSGYGITDAVFNISRQGDGILKYYVGSTANYLDLSHNHSYWDILDRPVDLEGFGLTDELNALYVTALGTSGNYLTWTKNGSTSNITIPYATLANTVTTAADTSNTLYLVGVTSEATTALKRDTSISVKGSAFNAGSVTTTGNVSVGGTLGVTGATTLTGLLTANGNITTGTSNGAYIQIGAIKLVYDSSNNALKVIKSDDTSANLYATGAVSALGANSSGGGGGGGMSLNEVWQSLTNEVADNYSTTKIHTNHIPDMAGIYGYLKSSALSGYVTSVKVGTTAYNPSSGVVSLPAYPTVPTKVSAFTNDSGYVTSSGVTSVATGTGLTGGTITSTGTVSISSTYRRYISNGNTAYEWGNHANAGYALASSLSSYLPLTGGTITGTINRKMSADTSNYEPAIYFVNVASGTKLAEIGYWNTYQKVYINPIGSSDVYNDANGKYSLVVGNNSLTYNTYTIYHAGNSNTTSVDWSCQHLTIAGNESSNITTVWNGNGAITTNSPSTNAAIRHAIRFNWYSTSWEIGNIRDSSDGTHGFGITSGNSTLVARFTTSGAVVYGEVTATSDARQKTLLGDTNLSVKQIADAPNIKFLWNDNRDEKTHIGSLAQYWDNVLPEAVTKDGTHGYMSLNYGALALCSAITIARMTINHEDRITMLERENAKLKARIAELEERRVA